MKALVITLASNEYSNVVADRCVQTAAQVGVQVEKFYGVEKEQAIATMEKYGLSWTWAIDNTHARTCPVTGLYQFPYTTSDFRAKVGCSMSHYLAWIKCVESKEPLLILEHDAVFIRPLPDIQFNGICQINDPAGATRKGTWWSQQMKARGGEGTFEKTWITTKNERHIPDGLAGNSAYLIKPWAAQELINKYHELGVWPNDAMMCKQLFPYLEEYYPFVVETRQEKSTTV